MNDHDHVQGQGQGQGRGQDLDLDLDQGHTAIPPVVVAGVEAEVEGGKEATVVEAVVEVEAGVLPEALVILVAGAGAQVVTVEAGVVIGISVAVTEIMEDIEVRAAETMAGRSATNRIDTKKRMILLHPPKIVQVRYTLKYLYK